MSSGISKKIYNDFEDEINGLEPSNLDKRIASYLNEDLEGLDSLEMRLILAPPRTGSTMLEKVIGKSPSDLVTIHEPFIDFGYRDKERESAYRAIAEELEGGEEASNNALIKEMTHWISKESAYKELIDFSSQPPLFLIRNPLLSTESKIRRVIESTSMKARLGTQRCLLDYFEGSPGERLGDPIEDLRPKYRKNPDLLRIETDKKAQDKLLDIYAEDKGYEDWEGMRERSFLDQNYQDYGDILEGLERRFSLFDLGWESLEEELEYTIMEDENPMVVDSTELRLSPERIVDEITYNWILDYKDSMLEWSDSEKGYGKQDRPHERIWYGSLNDSNGVKPPSEPAPSFHDFPDFIEDYIREVAFPIYRKAFESGYRVKDKRLVEGVKEGRVGIKEVDPLFCYLVEEADSRSGELNSINVGI